jgi:predicted DNA binding CopG/RHH family protein
MSQGKKKLPKFHSAVEEGAYWEEHSLTEHLDQFQPAGRTRFVRPVKRLVSMRYDVTLLQQIRVLAARKGIPYQTLMHQWLTERTNEELTMTGKPSRRRGVMAGARA